MRSFLFANIECFCSGAVQTMLSQNWRISTPSLSPYYLFYYLCPCFLTRKAIRKVPNFQMFTQPISIFFKVTETANRGQRQLLFLTSRFRQIQQFPIGRNIYVQIKFTGGEKIQKIISILDTTAGGVLCTEFAAYILPLFNDNQTRNQSS